MKSVMGDLINFYFNGSDKEFIDRYDAFWTNSQQKCRLSVMTHLLTIETP